MTIFLRSKKYLNSVPLLLVSSINCSVASTINVPFAPPNFSPVALNPVFIEKKRVASGSDDAEEKTSSGKVSLSSSDLELVEDRGNQLVGMRFNNLSIPPGAIIVNAYIQFQTDEKNSTNTSLEIKGEDTDNAVTFSSSRNNISDRISTISSVNWNPNEWTSVGESGLEQKTPNINIIVQEIISRAGWSLGNSLAIIISGSGERTAESYNGDSSAAPLLHIEYTTEPDFDAPSVPTGLTATALSSSRIKLTWDPSSDNVAVAGYTINRCLGSSCEPVAEIKTTTTTVYTDSSLAAETAYTYTISAFDPSGNTSQDSDPVTIATRQVNQAGTYTLVGAGDIAGKRVGAEATAKILDDIVATDSETTVFTAGDNAYNDGTTNDFITNYDSTWGRHRERTYPSSGNHDYHVSGAKDYLDYFCPNSQDCVFPGGTQQLYYSYDLGNWHIISLDSNAEYKSGSAQLEWLKQDLEDNAGSCILAYWHHAYYSSARHGSNSKGTAFWEELYAAGADVVVAGHDHVYERFAKQDSNGNATSEGVRSFTAGAGGNALYDFSSILDNSEARYNKAYGVISFTLRPNGYDWEYITEAGDNYSDSGSDSCNNISENQAPTVSNISIYGTTKVGKTLTGHYTYRDVDGDAEGSSTYRWLRDGAAINGATSKSYTLISTDVDSRIKFEVTPIAATGVSSGAVVQSAKTEPITTIITNPNQAPTANNVSISGTAKVGKILIGSYTYNDVDGDAEGNSTYRWLRDGTAINGATSESYTLVSADVDSRIRFEVTPIATTGISSGAVVQSAKTAPITTIITNPNQAPTANNVSISGAAKVGQTLTGSYTYNDVDGDAEGNSTYRWLRDETAINGATSESYTLVSADVNARIRFEVTPSAVTGVSSGAIVQSQPVGPVTDGSVSRQTIEARISSSSDDAEERTSSNSMYLDSSDLELVNDGSSRHQLVGLRFNNLSIPQGATILNAYLQFTADEKDSIETVLDIQGEDTDNALTFSSSNNISNRNQTVSSVNWNPNEWSIRGEAGAKQKTPDISTVIQEIINRGGWSAGNSLALIISGTGERTAESYDGDTAAAPLLHIEYAATTIGVKNQAPTASHVSILGTEEIGQVLVGDYAYHDIDGDAEGNSTYRWFHNETLISGATSDSYTLTPADEGALISFEITPKANTGISSGIATRSAPVGPIKSVIIIGNNSVTVRISSSSDDAEEKVATGKISLSSSDLELSEEGSRSKNQLIGLRFNSLSIPQGATITNAYIQFKVDEKDSKTTSLTIKGEHAGNATTFTSSRHNISSRQQTAASVNWNPASWTVKGEVGINQKTPDMSTIIQEIVNQLDWATGHSLAIIVTGNGKRTAESYDGDSVGAPMLHIEYDF